MAKMQSKFKYMYDAAPSVSFINNDGVAKTASFTGNVITLDKLDGYWNTDGELADAVISAILNVTNVDHTTGDETYSFVVEGSVDAAFTAPVTLGTIAAAVPATGQYVALIDMDAATEVLPGVSYVRIKATLAGTTPSVTCFAWIGDIKIA